MMNRCLLLSIGFMLITATAARVEADGAAAGRAFADGQAAQLEGDYDHAAQSYELAYSIAPSVEALRSAVRAREQAGQIARAAALAEILLAQFPADTVSAKLASDVIAEAKPKFARVVIACSGKCTVTIGGRAISLTSAASHVIYATPGNQALEITFEGGGVVTRELTMAAGAEQRVTVDKPALKPTEPLPITEPKVTKPSAVATKSGHSPAFAIVGAVITVGFGATAVWSGIDTNHAHDAYVANPDHDAFEAGRTKQLRTNILIGSAIGTGLLTAAVAVFWTRWSSSETQPAVAVDHNGGTVSLIGSF
jgi:hypothetical protein